LARVQEDSRSNGLWRSLSGVLGRDKRAGGCPTSLDADGLADQFSRKVADIRAATDGSLSQDPIPTFLLKEVISVLLPFITALINASLSQGRLPMSQKQAIVTPLLKNQIKSNLLASRFGHSRHCQLQACVQPDLSLKNSRACCRQAAERILGGERSTTATTVCLSTRSFYGDGAYLFV